ncbi:hypothetical protein MA16_Dca019871 [Dendrobium catenatum]|uniref:Uncharacterized protein n=1 Tax=Dendrobium catenatum TaxID=906689 RepID=A0A2I0WXI8_9ASPA|nr:hypothetical protein MA16_Dca019871 [Dendrobium catenatum]
MIDLRTVAFCIPHNNFSIIDSRGQMHEFGRVGKMHVASGSAGIDGEGDLKRLDLDAAKNCEI